MAAQKITRVWTEKPPEDKGIAPFMAREGLPLWKAMRHEGNDLVGDRGALTNSGVTNAMRAKMPALTLKGNNTGVASNPLDLSVAQALLLLGAFSVLSAQAFTVAGTSTYTPTAGMKYCLVM